MRAFDRDFRGVQIGRCEACGVLAMNPQYSEGHLARFYASYISVDDQDRGDHVEGSRKHPEIRRIGKRRSLQLMASYIEPGRLLSVGSGDGLELGIAKDLGWEVEGYDVDPATTGEVSARFDVPVHSGAFEDLERPDGWFDAVFMDQVLEHLKQPRRYLDKIARLLRPGGVLFLGVPNIGSFSNRLKTASGRLGLRRRRRGKHYASKHHILYFTPAVLRDLLQRQYDFEILTLRGSLKPQHKPLTARLSRWLPSLDSGMLAVARRRA
ncbi:MAG: class I SAM-dependent methyltransferase [Planctomycetota bacterium]